MNDKRDAETDLLLDIQKIIGAELSYEGVTLARYIESREAEIRRQIADDLETMDSARYFSTEGLRNAHDAYIKKLRGNK